MVLMTSFFGGIIVDPRVRLGLLVGLQAWIGAWANGLKVGLDWAREGQPSGIITSLPLLHL